MDYLRQEAVRRAAQVLPYLGPYTDRVAIANSGIKACDDDHVAFAWKNYRHDGALKVMRLRPDEFIWRFLPHALPDGFHRIRHFGFLANSQRAERLALCRSFLTNEAEPLANGTDNPPAPEPDDRIDFDPPACSECGGVMRFVAHVPLAATRLAQHIAIPM